jgi:hypothetical protein
LNIRLLTLYLPCRKRHHGCSRHRNTLPLHAAISVAIHVQIGKWSGCGM